MNAPYVCPFCLDDPLFLFGRHPKCSYCADNVATSCPGCTCPDSTLDREDHDPDVLDTADLGDVYVDPDDFAVG
jgi:hypothetical protein